MEPVIKPTLEWLREHAVVMSSRHLATNKMAMAPREMAWILPDHLVEKFIFHLTGENAHFNIGGALGRLYFTTACGLVIIDPMGVRKSDLFEFNGYKIVNLEVDRTVKWVHPLSIHIQRLQ